MYTEQAIVDLINRIGWEKPLSSEIAITIDLANSTATSGRKVNSFHQMATVENIYYAVSEVNIQDEKFNDFLSSIREQSVREVVATILDQHHLYDETIDYSSVMVQKAKLFDEAIGYCMASKVLELLITTTRINATERSNAMSYQTLKVELEGAKNDSGFTVAKGIVHRYQNAIKKAQKIIFPDPILIIGGNDW